VLSFRRVAIGCDHGRSHREHTADYVDATYRFYSRGKSHWLPEQAPDEIDPLPLDHPGAREAGL
jgi:hypothetical protein